MSGKSRVSAMAAVAVLTGALFVVLPEVPATATDEPCHWPVDQLYITMTDGVRLRYGIALPADLANNEEELCRADRYPLVFQYSVYGHGYGGVPHWRALLQEGYAVMSVAVRGTGCSSGTWDPLSPRERSDVHEIVDWATKQWWSDGRVALIGGSAPAIQALAGAPGAPDALRAVVAEAPSTDFYRDTLRPGGIWNSLPAYTAVQAGLSSGGAALAVPPNLNPHESRGTDEECARNLATEPSIFPVVDAMQWEWDEGIIHDRSPMRDAADITAPVFLAAAWQDEFTGSRGVDILSELRVPYHAILSNGGHDIGSWQRIADEVVAFLNRYVKGTSAEYDQPPVEIWWDTTLLGGARWKTSHDRWPVPQTKPSSLSLAAGGTLGEAAPSEPGADSYVYAPGNGQSPSWAGGWATPPKPGSYQAYTYEVPQDLVVAGSASLDLWLSSTASDTDVQVILSEVSDTDEIYVAQGFLRASHRELDRSRSTATRPYHTHQRVDSKPLSGTELLRVEIMPFAHAFRAGTKLRVYIESPRLVDVWTLHSDRDPAVNTIHYGGATPSRLVLPELRKVSPDDQRTACDPLMRRLCRPALPPTTSGP